jgi:hypothetical protein
MVFRPCRVPIAGNEPYIANPWIAPVVSPYSCQDAPTIDDRRLSDVSLGIHVKNRVEELHAVASDVAYGLLPRGLEDKNH